jgi:septal ring factor EnvC (AmiA/AmiB activator)
MSKIEIEIKVANSEPIQYTVDAGACPPYVCGQTLRFVDADVINRYQADYDKAIRQRNEARDERDKTAIELRNVRKQLSQKDEFISGLHKELDDVRTTWHRVCDDLEYTQKCHAVEVTNRQTAEALLRKMLHNDDVPLRLRHDVIDWLSKNDPTKLCPK